jgi:hypothetical protein
MLGNGVNDFAVVPELTVGTYALVRQRAAATPNGIEQDLDHLLPIL